MEMKGGREGGGRKGAREGGREGGLPLIQNAVPVTNTQMLLSKKLKDKSEERKLLPWSVPLLWCFERPC